MTLSLPQFNPYIADARKTATSCRVWQYKINQGRLNQWAHWARAQGPRIFFLFEGPQLAVVK